MDDVGSGVLTGGTCCEVKLVLLVLVVDVLVVSGGRELGF
jgi:hypothetical protein